MNRTMTNLNLEGAGALSIYKQNDQGDLQSPDQKL
jgi:hypothetical protein